VVALNGYWIARGKRDGSDHGMSLATFTDSEILEDIEIL